MTTALVRSETRAIESPLKAQYFFISISHMIFFVDQPDPGAKQNLNPVYTAAPKFVKSVKNGKLYRAGEGEDAFDIVHVYGKLWISYLSLCVRKSTIWVFALRRLRSAWKSAQSDQSLNRCLIGRKEPHLSTGGQ